LENVGIFYGENSPNLVTLLTYLVRMLQKGFVRPQVWQVGQAPQREDVVGAAVVQDVAGVVVPKNEATRFSNASTDRLHMYVVEGAKSLYT
jgi:hypothetical protein